MVETLVALVSEWDVAPIAEGVENADEEATCIDLGFAYAQGFRYGRPAPAADFAAG
jgi:EAL domain-containing protein (putative c-di-GMP-specific phosphodiesterase class I)